MLNLLPGRERVRITSGGVHVMQQHLFFCILVQNAAKLAQGKSRLSCEKRGVDKQAIAVVK